MRINRPEIVEAEGSNPAIISQSRLDRDEYSWEDEMEALEAWSEEDSETAELSLDDYLSGL